MISPRTYRRSVRASCRFALFTCVGVAAAACSSPPEAESDAATRARQMRDVAHMLDAMEAPPEPGAPIPKPVTRAPISLREDTPAPREAESHMLLVIGVATAGAAALSSLAALLVARARRRRGGAPAISIAAAFPSDHALPPAPSPAKEADMPTTTEQPAGPAPADAPPPRATYEAPTVQLTLQPAAPLPRPKRRARPSEPAVPSLAQRLHAPGMPARLFLTGDRTYPAIRHTGTLADDFVDWETILRDAVRGQGEDAALARWLLPELLWRKAALLSRNDAIAPFDEAIMRCANGYADAYSTECPRWRAHWLRAHLARLSRQSGATRLLSLRDLGSDGDDNAAPVLDAWAGIHLAWADWLIGGARLSRLALAVDCADRLEQAGARPRAMRRRAEAAVRRAGLLKGDAKLSELDHAQSLFQAAMAGDADPANTLLFAGCVHQRAALLPPDEAGEACSLALSHAFEASEHPAWRIEALELRLAVQLTHDALPGHAPSGDIITTLRREIADARSLTYPGTP